ncbi:hypothetical protein EON00_11400 [Burkholderia sp. ISTR5]|nr:hypothetical protein [Burkholderia sp. ISTR5]
MVLGQRNWTPGTDSIRQRSLRRRKQRKRSGAFPPLYPFAQWALESGFWHHLPSGSNNPFGVKRTSRI